LDDNEFPTGSIIAIVLACIAIALILILGGLFIYNTYVKKP